MFHSSGKTPATAKGTPMYVICQEHVRFKAGMGIMPLLTMSAAETISNYHSSDTMGPMMVNGKQERERERKRKREGGRVGDDRVQG